MRDSISLTSQETRSGKKLDDLWDQKVHKLTSEFLGCFNSLLWKTSGI